MCRDPAPESRSVVFCCVGSIDHCVHDHIAAASHMQPKLGADVTTLPCAQCEINQLFR